MIRSPDASEEAANDLDLETVRSVAADLFVHLFPMVLIDAVRQAHGWDRRQFQLAPQEAASLAPGFEGDDDGLVVLASAWLDLEQEPAILRLPHTHGRHTELNLWDASGTIFASFGARTGEDSGGDIALVGPRWRGQLPSSLKVRRAPTDGVWAVSRIHAHSLLDRPTALARAHRLCVALLRCERELLHPAVGVLQPPLVSCLRQAEDISPADLFARLDNLVARADPTGQSRFRSRLGDLLGRLGGPPGPSAWSPAFVEALERGFADGLSAIRTAGAQTTRRTPGWRVAPPGLGDSGLDSLTRAARAFTSLGAPPREDLLTLVCDRDDRGWPLSSVNGYRLHFAQNALPPVQGFWRLSVRATSARERPRGLGDRSDLIPNPDGSLDIFVQHAPPAPGQIRNWLQAPPGEWTLVMRLHNPRPEAFSKAWRMPAVDRLGGRGAGANPGPWRWRPAFTPQPRLRDPHRPPSEELSL